MKLAQEDIKVIWVKSIFYGFIILLCLFMFILAPKKIFQENDAYELATSMAITNEENLMLYDYDVYSNNERFAQGLIDDVAQTKSSFKDRNEVMAIKIYGVESKTEYKDDYVFIEDPEVPQLNIEYYIVKDIQFDETNLPARTFIMLFNDVGTLANHIYFAILLFVSLLIVFPFSIKLTKVIIHIQKYNQKELK